jgi:hypothetical protein
LSAVAKLVSVIYRILHSTLDRQEMKRAVRLSATLCGHAALIVMLAGCGRPKPPDLRSEMANAIVQLNLRPVYPPTETLRLGTVVLADTAVGRPSGGAAAYQETSFRITGDLEGVFEQVRRQRYSNLNRFTQSSSNLTNTMNPMATGTNFYRQAPEKADEKALENSLPLAALPGFSLASVDQVSLSAFVPEVVASFFGALGLRQTSFLRMEAEGIEVAELPLADFLDALAQGCTSPTVQARRNRYADAVVLGYTLFHAQRDRRLQEGSSNATAPATSMLIMRRVLYMRGVRFIVSDSRVGTAALQAAIRSTLPNGNTPMQLPGVTVNTNVAPTMQGTPAAGSPAEAAAANAAAITALQGQMEQLRGAITSGGNTQISLSLARAAGTGIELVQLFDRPLAFGYQGTALRTCRASAVNRA